MGLQKFKQEKFDNIISSMVDYMTIEEDFDCGYTQKEIDECCEILDSYIDGLTESNGNAEDIMKCVEKVVKALNRLNEKADYGLIETDERENLCSFIENAAIEAGLSEPDDDVTEEWREW